MIHTVGRLKRRMNENETEEGTESDEEKLQGEDLK